MGRRPHTAPYCGATDEWLTPPEWVRALGPFDLDPCAPDPRPWDTAARHYTFRDNGLIRPWEGRVWLNPPYSAGIGSWLGRLARHGDGVALVFARTETKWWHRHIWPVADLILFVEGRPHFHHPDGTRARGNSGAPVALVAYGEANVAALRRSGIRGALVAPIHAIHPAPSE